MTRITAFALPLMLLGVAGSQPAGAMTPEERRAYLAKLQQILPDVRSFDQWLQSPLVSVLRLIVRGHAWFSAEWKPRSMDRRLAGVYVPAAWTSANRTEEIVRFMRVPFR